MSALSDDLPRPSAERLRADIEALTGMTRPDVPYTRRAFSDEDRAAYLELDSDQFYQLYFEASVMQIVSLEDVVGDSEHEDLDPLVVLESVRSKDPDPHITAIINEQRNLLQQCVSWLPKPEQSVIRMYYYQGMTLKQIAKEIGRSESRAHQLHAQAIMRLSGFLSRTQGLFHDSENALLLPKRARALAGAGRK